MLINHSAAAVVDKRWRRTALALALCLGLLAAIGLATADQSRAASAGTVDTAFAAALGSGFNGDVSVVTEQADGKILVGGFFTEVDGTASGYLARLNADGTLDTAFTSGMGSGFDSAVATIAVQDNNQIVVGGEFTSVDGEIANGVARLNADGSPDTSFATNLGSGFDDIVGAVALQADGKIVVGGDFTNVAGTTSNYVARLNSDGSVDTGFSANMGSGFNDYVTAVTVQQDGKILVGGAFWEVDGASTTNFARLNSDGTPDTTFNANMGTAFNDTIYGIAEQSDHAIVVAGYFTTLNGSASKSVARLNSDGTPDTAFSTNLGTGFNDAASSVALTDNGEILVGGYFSEVDGTNSARLAQLNSDGTLDTAFSTNLGTGFDNDVSSVSVQGDQSILVGGVFDAVDGTSSPHVARLFGATPTFSVTPTSYDYGSVKTSDSADQTFTVTNTGSGSLLISEVTLGGSSADQYNVASQDCDAGPIAAAGTCTVTVTFVPTSVGSKAAELQFTDNAAGSPHQVTLSGTGTSAPTPTPTPTPSPTPTPTVKKAQKPVKRAKLPLRIKWAGKTVLAPKNPLTNAGQRLRTVVRGRPAKASAAGEVRYFTVVRGSKGKVSVITYGKPVRITVGQTARATSEYKRYRAMTVYRNGKRL